MILHNIGISGCKTELIGNALVRKTSPSISYNSRLRKQMMKQVEFREYSFNHIFTPKVYDSGYQNELFYFDMEYVDGKLFNEEFYRISKSEIDTIADTLLSYLDESKRKSTFYSDNEVKRAIYAKLLAVRPDSRHQLLIDYILSELDQLQLGQLANGMCHGDLTFSNILFSSGKLCYLDLLDSYLESYVIDIVKLKQDAYYKWYLNILPVSECHVTRTHQIFDYLWKRISEHHSEIISSDLFAVLDVLNLLRIEPYLQVDRQHTLLYNIIRKTKLYEDFDSTHDGKVHTIPKS